MVDVILYNYGGIYMDTDVEIIKNIDVFLDNNAFSSFENNITSTKPTIMNSFRNFFHLLFLQIYF